MTNYTLSFLRTERSIVMAVIIKGNKHLKAYYYCLDLLCKACEMTLKKTFDSTSLHLRGGPDINFAGYPAMAR